MKTICGLERCRVRTTEGDSLGRAFDFRCTWRDGRLVVTHLLCGRRGLLELLGFREPRVETLPWSAVMQFDDRAIVVNATRRR